MPEVVPGLGDGSLGGAHRGEDFVHAEGCVFLLSRHQRETEPHRVPGCDAASSQDEIQEWHAQVEREGRVHGRASDDSDRSAGGPIGRRHGADPFFGRETVEPAFASAPHQEMRRGGA